MTNEQINQFEQSIESFMQELPANVLEANRGAFDTMKTLITMQKQKQEPGGRVKEGEVYYYLTTNVEGTKIEIHDAYDFRHDLDNKRRDTGNYFESRVDAYIRQSIIENFFQEKKDE